MINITSNNKSGFTMVESLVAITILIIGVLGPLVFLANGISDGLYAQNQLTAALLAQEGVELVINQNVRDRALRGDGLSTIGSWQGVKIDDYRSFAISGVNGHTEYLLYNPDLYATNLGGYSNDGNSNNYHFIREIKLTTLDPTGDSLNLGRKVEVTVWWRNVRGGADRSLKVIDYVYN